MIIKFENRYIEYKTKKALLVRLPKVRAKVWIPKSLVKPRFWFYTAFLPQDMKFTLVIGEVNKHCSAAKLKQLFDEGDIFNEIPRVTYHVPKKLKPKKKVEIDESLKR